MPFNTSSIFSSLSRADFFGQGLFFYIHGEKCVKSRFGGFISVCVLALALYSLINALIIWRNNGNLQMVSSNQNLVLSEIIPNNISFVYDLTYENYAIYFVPMAILPNGDQLNYTSLSRYFRQQFVYTDSQNSDHDFPFERCNLKKRSAFTLVPYDGGDNDTSSWSICPGRTVEMGLYSDPILYEANQSKLSYQIIKCENSTENNNFCASDAEIADMVQYTTIQATIPKTSYDFNNPGTPLKRNYDVQLYHLDMSLAKQFTAFVFPNLLKTDRGVFSEDYVLDSVDLNIDYVQYETSLRKAKDPVLMKYEILLNLNRQAYLRKNLKIQDIFASFGGTLSLLMSIGNFLCMYYNMWMMKHKLINIAFDKAEDNELER